MIYLDHNATTHVDPRVAEAMSGTLSLEFGNPSSAHPYGTRAREILARARRDVGSLLGVHPEEVIFTSGGSESNNLALKGIAFEKGKGHIITCLGEHPAVLEPCAFLERSGFTVTRLPLDGQGRVDPGAVRSAIRPDTILISVMHANNETGTVQPIAEIGRTARERGIPFHSDAAQSAGKIPVSAADLNADLLTVAGHKLYAPKGVGALYVRKGLRLCPIIHGASQEGGLRAGTEAVHLAVGLGTASRIAREEMGSVGPRLRILRDLLHRLLREAIPELTLNGHLEDRLPNTLNVNFPGVSGAEILQAAPAIAASTGSACHSGETRLSPVLKAMGVPPERGRGAVRLTLGRSTTEAEVREAAAALTRAFRSIRSDP